MHFKPTSDERQDIPDFADYVELKAERNKLRADCDELQRFNQELDEFNDKLIAENERLRAALESKPTFGPDVDADLKFAIETMRMKEEK